MKIGTPSQWWSIIILGLSLTYGIFLLTYLNATKKYALDMSKKDQDIRKAAVIITWIEIILTSLAIVGFAINILTGTQSNYSPVLM